MILTLHTETVIDSSHKLCNYEGNCKRVHGHSWFVEVWIKGDSSLCDNIGILFDFGNIKKLKDKYDHFYINDIEPFDKINPTAENLCMQFYEELKEIKPKLDFKVKVFETKVGKETWCQCGDFE